VTDFFRQSNELSKNAVLAGFSGFNMAKELSVLVGRN